MEPLPGISRRHYQDIVASIGTAGMGSALLTAANALAIDEIFAFAQTRQQRPRPLAYSGAHAAFGRRVRMYSDRFHHLDPLLRTLDGAGVGDAEVACRVRADEIGDADYRRQCFDEPRFFEKFSLAQRQDGGWCVLSLYRQDGRPQASDESLLGFLQVVTPLMARHAGLLEAADLPLLEKVERRIARHYPTLTAREQAVCARTLIGMTAEAIALDLGIGQATVLTYRRRAYERLNISAANQLIGRLLS